jgi:arylsulfatase A-like enzyme
MTLRIAALLFLAGAAGCSRDSSTSSKLNLDPHPFNLIVLNVELLRADHVGLISGRTELTPNTDRFFADGIVFTDATAPAGATYLSATAIATGTEAMINDHRLTSLGVGVNEAVARDGRRLVDHLPTIAETLSEHGYLTVALNEWQHTGPKVHLDRGFDEFVQVTAPGRAINTTEEGVTLIGEQVDRLRTLLERCRGERFYLYFHPNSLHSPYRLPIERARRSPALLAELQTFGDVNDRFVAVHALRARERMNDLRTRGGVQASIAMQERRLRALVRRMYEEQLLYVDEELGRFIADLERGGFLEKTIVLLYSNHGTGLFDNDVITQGVSYQSCARVPLLIRHPGVRSTVRVDTPVSLVDLAATIYELLGVAPRVTVPAHSLLPPIRGLPYGRASILGRNVQTEFIRQGHWKLIVNGADSRELYDLSNDANENKNLYDPDLEIARVLEADLRREKMTQHRLRLELSRRLGVEGGWPEEASALKSR